MFKYAVYPSSIVFDSLFESIAMNEYTEHVLAAKSLCSMHRCFFDSSKRMYDSEYIDKFRTESIYIYLEARCE